MAGDRRPPHGAVYLLLLLPYNIPVGYTSVTLAFILAKAGVSTAAIAGLVGAGLFPTTWSFVWSPVADSSLSYRAWYLIGAAALGLCVAAMGLLPPLAESLPLLGVLAFLASLAATFPAQAATALMAHHTEAGHQGGAAGWAAAGNIAGSGLGGGLGLWLAQHSNVSWLPAAVLGAICVACCGALAFVHEPAHTHRAPRILPTLVNIGRDVLAMARSRTGFLAIVLLLMPMGTGAAANLWSAVSHDWHAGADQVALVTGVAGGVVSMLGCLAMGRFTDVLSPRRAYMGGAFLMSVTGLAMAFAPKTPLAFTLFTLTYAFTNGFMFASFTAVMLEAIGRGCAATKAPVMSSLTNIPILVMTLADGNAQTHFGSGGMLKAEALISFAAIALFAAFSAAVRMRTAPVAA